MAVEKNKTPEIDFSGSAGDGCQNVTINDLAKPFLVILQKLSPQVDENNSEFIRGAKAGMIFNTVLKEVYDGKEGIYFIPTGFVSMLVEWKPRTSGGGLVAMHKDLSTVGETTKNEKGFPVNKAGNIIMQTAYHYGKYKDKKGATQFAVISMASSQMKKSKAWLSNIMSIRMKTSDGKEFTPASYSHQYKLTTIAENNDKGNWFGWKIENAGKLTESNLYIECKENAKMVSSEGLLLTTTPDEPVGAAVEANKDY